MESPADEVPQPTILIVNDSAAALVALKAVLEGPLLRVLTAPSGEEALRVLLAQDAAVILMDVNMPGMGGFEAAEYIRQRPRDAATPIIFVTAARPEESDQFRGYELGAVDYLIAPVVPHVLRSKVAMFVELYRRRRQVELQAEELARLNRELEAQHIVELKRMNAELSTEIAERKRTEAALVQAQKMEAVGQLTGGLAHDFNNLLTIILGNMQLLEVELANHPFPLARVQAAAKAAWRGAALVRNLLAFSRRQALQPQALNVNELIGGMTDLLQSTLGENIAITPHEAPDLWITLADRAQVDAAILNLAVNARDAMPQGGRLLVETGNVRLDEHYAARELGVKPGDYVMLAVTDTGTGMGPEVLRHAFEPFYTTKEAGKGTGLGLSMVYGFAKQSGGHVKIYSELGHGTTVKLYLPRAGTAAAAISPATVDVNAGGGETILVVEDDDGVRALSVMLLEHHGYRVLEAANGTDALEVLEREQIDLLFTDVLMPGRFTGPELALEARRRRPGLKVLFTSGYTENAMTEQDRLGQGAPLISKPYDGAELGSKIRAVLDAPPEHTQSTGG